MKQDTAIALGTPVIAAAVFGLAGSLLNTNVTAAGLVLGWIAGQLAIHDRFIVAKPQTVKALETNALPPTQTVWNLPQEDGFTSRVSSDIPIGQWQAVAQRVIIKNAKNLSQNVVAKALPHLVQDDHRSIHQEMTGLLSHETVRVIVWRGNHAEITDPIGRIFFMRLANGKFYPLNKYNLPHSLQDRNLSRNTDFTEHARATRAEFETL